MEQPAPEQLAEQMAGPIEKAILRDLRSIHSEHPLRRSLEQLALALAQNLDANESPMSAAAIGRELRATLAAITDLRGPDDGERALGEFLAGLTDVSPALGNTTDTKP